MENVVGKHFIDRLEQAMDKKSSCLIVGLDPNLELIPQSFCEKYGDLKDTSVQLEVIKDYCLLVLEQIKDYAVGVKPQIAYFEVYGFQGLKVLEELVLRSKELGLLVIMDAKRGDISSTAEAYAKAYLSDTPLSSDALTINPYLGLDSVTPFIDYAKKYNKGLFVLLHTSNPSSADLQLFGNEEKKVVDKVIEILQPSINESKGENGVSFIGFVVGATKSDKFTEFRDKIPNSYFLIPGVGAQGGKVSDLKGALNKNGKGILVNSSRKIMYPHKYNQKPFESGDIAKEAKTTLEMLKSLN